jgi:hypothetical protein
VHPRRVGQFRCGVVDDVGAVDEATQRVVGAEGIVREIGRVPREIRRERLGRWPAAPGERAHLVAALKVQASDLATDEAVRARDGDDEARGSEASRMERSAGHAPNVRPRRGGGVLGRGTVVRINPVARTSDFGD